MPSGTKSLPKPMLIEIYEWGNHQHHFYFSSGLWFNMMMLSYQYRKYHYGDKTVIRLSYLRNGIFYNGRVASLHGISPHSILNQPRTEIYQWEKWPYHFQSKLTHLSLDKMAAISQMIFSDEFVWMKSFVFWLKFHRGLFLKVQLAIIQHWFR